MVMYLEDAKMILSLDHKHLTKYLFSTTNNIKVDNWTFELSECNIHFEWLPVSQNMLADYVSYLLHLGKTELPPEEKGFVFSKYIFKEEPSIKQNVEKYSKCLPPWK